jgi:hypothetical protein
MRACVVALMAALVVLVGCPGDRAPDVQPEPSVSPWQTAPAPDASEGIPPRNQYFREGGTGVVADTFPPDGGSPTGTVIIGPVSVLGGAAGAGNSVAHKDFDCGPDPAGQCTVEVHVSADYPTSGGIPPYSSHEFLDITLQHLDAAGNPTGAPASTAVHAGTDLAKTHTLVLQGCGRVRLTVAFREDTPGPDNPAGVQTKFSAALRSYRCQ